MQPPALLHGLHRFAFIDFVIAQQSFGQIRNAHNHPSIFKRKFAGGKMPSVLGPAGWGKLTISQSGRKSRCRVLHCPVFGTWNKLGGAGDGGICPEREPTPPKRKEATCEES